MCRRHLLAVLLSAAALAPLARAAEPVATIGGVTFDGRSQVGGQSLVLNGVGARAVAVFKAYVAALYLPRRAQTVEAIAAMPGAKRLQMRMFYDIPMAEFAKAFRQGVERNQTPEVQQRLADRVAAFGALVTTQEKARKGDTVNLDFVPGSGMQFWLNGKQIGAAIPGDDFYTALLHVFLGEHVADERLRAGLLGRAD